MEINDETLIMQRPLTGNKQRKTKTPAPNNIVGKFQLRQVRTVVVNGLKVSFAPHVVIGKFIAAHKYLNLGHTFYNRYHIHG